MRWLAIVLLSATSVAAEPAPGNVFVVGGVMMDTDRFVNGALTIDSGVRWPETPLWLHVNGAWGGTADLFDGTGPFRRAMAGVETEGPCRLDGDRWSCLLLGIDAGYETSRVHYVDFPEYSDHGFVAAARLGLQGTWGHFAVRSDFHAVIHRESDAQWQWGFGVALAVGYRR